MDVRRKEKIEAPSSMPAPGSIAKTASVRFGYLVSSLCVLAALAPPANAQSDCVYDLRGETNVSGHAPYRLKLSQQGSAISGSAEILAPDGTSVVNRGEVTGQAGFENFWLEFRWERGDPYNPVRLQGARRKDDRYVAEIVYSYTGEYFRIGLARPSVCMNYRLYKPMLDVDARVPGQFGLLLRAQAEGPVRGLLQLYRQGEVIWSRNTDPSTAYNVPIGSPAGEEYHACFQSGLQTQCTRKTASDRYSQCSRATAGPGTRNATRCGKPTSGRPICRPGGRAGQCCAADGHVDVARPEERACGHRRHLRFRIRMA
ncbi:MAG: hypothetical protein WDN24_19395 [Sphingomonas sp.]